MQNFGLSSILATYMRGLESEGVEWGAELRELRFQAAWRNTQWDCDLSERYGEENGELHKKQVLSIIRLEEISLDTFFYSLQIKFFFNQE